MRKKLLFLCIMDTIRAKYIEINKRIFNNRDGEILQMQKEYGAIYTKSLGVSVLSLENIAKDYEPSHQLAQLLWAFGGREQTLVAAMLEEPKKVVPKELETQLLKMETAELWEQVAKHLLRRLPNIEEYINAWLESKEERLHIFAMLSLNYFPDKFSKDLLEKIMQIEVKEGSYLQKCMQRVLLKIGARAEQFYALLRENSKMQRNYKSLLDEIALFYV